MRTYCTLFDKNYLYQGIALHDSLRRFSRDFILYALCMDETSYRVIAKMKYEGLAPVKVEDLLAPELSALRQRTTHGQFCWACQPFICELLLREQGRDMVTYLEADSLFFSDPAILFDELGNHSISLVPHRYAPEFDQTRTSGIYCVQFNAFRRDATSWAALNYWKECCLEYTKEKPLAYPGQLCLDDWPSRFNGVKVIEHSGAGVAPWNVQHREISLADSMPQVDGVAVVFYHFHQYGRYRDGSHELGYYPLTRQVIDTFYSPYVHALAEAERRVQAADPSFHYRKTYDDHKSLRDLLTSPTADGLRDYLNVFKRKLRGYHNVLPNAYFLEN